jgi:hypothetical protein
LRLAHRVAQRHLLEREQQIGAGFDAHGARRDLGKVLVVKQARNLARPSCAQHSVWAASL